jgi:hypothetical protein
MRLVAMMMAAGCTTGTGLIEGEGTGLAQREAVSCYTVHTTDNALAVAKVDLEQRSQDPVHALFTVPDHTSLDIVSTQNLAQVDNTLVVRLYEGGAYPVVALDLDTGDAAVLGAYFNSVGGRQELVATCALGPGLCIFDGLSAFEARVPTERIEGIEADALETFGGQVFGMDRQRPELLVWDRDGTPAPTLALEGFTGQSLGMSIVDDRLYVLEDGLFAEPFSPYATLRVYSVQDGTLLDTLRLDGLGDAFVAGLSCELE